MVGWKKEMASLKGGGREFIVNCTCDLVEVIPSLFETQIQVKFEILVLEGGGIITADW